MKRAFFLSLVVAGGLLAGCDDSSQPTAATSASVPSEPTHAQPKLRTMKIYLGPETFDAELALSQEEIMTGMMFRTNIPESDAMLFNLRVPEQADFWMKNCPESISAAYMSPDGVIREIHHLEKNDTNGVVAARNDIQFVLETKDGWFDRHNVKVGTMITSENGPLTDALRELPTHAQPKLQTMKIYLGAESFDAELALSDDEIHTGMMFRTNIQETDAMLFNLRYPQRANCWMKNCPESISAAYITSDGVIQEIHHLEKNDMNGVTAGRDDIVFVLETKDGWFQRHNINVGTAIQAEKGSLAEVLLRR